MQEISLTSFLFGAVIAGLLATLAGWLSHRRARQSVENLLKAQFAGDIATLTTKLEAALAERSGLIDRLSQSEQRYDDCSKECSELKVERAQLETLLKEERQQSIEKLALLESAQTKLSDAFRALSAEALKSNNESFITLARGTFEKLQATAAGDLEKREKAVEQMISPVKEALAKFDKNVTEIEKARIGAYEGLSQQVKGLHELHSQLRGETSNLVRALGTPRVRGRWGEIQLRRVVEMAGMLEHCDFREQASVTTEEGARLRPDLVISIPGGKQIVVDAKAPLAGYLEAVECQNEEDKRVKLETHARQLRDHLSQLGKKSYWDQFQPSPELVVMFIPGEGFLSAAFEYDPSIIEAGINERVVVASPMTLIALLRAIAFGWRQESLAQNAQKISDLARELYKRLADMGAHFENLGKRLSGAVEAYNQALGSLETRVLPNARKFTELGISLADREIEQLVQVENTPRVIQAPELSQQQKAL